MVLKTGTTINPNYSLFPHSERFDQGLKKNHVRPGQATMVVALDGTGDFESIADAVSELPSTGGVVYIKEGTYNIKSKIILPTDYISLQGAGPSTILKASTGLTGTIIEVNSKEGIVINSLKFEGNSISANGVELNSCTESLITGCWFSEIEDVSIKSATGSNNIITSNFILNCIGNNIETSDNYTVITSNTIYNSGAHGIALLSDSDYCIVNSNTLNIGAGHGISVQLDSDYNIVTSNIVNSFDYGFNITSEQANRTFVTTNIFRNSDTANFTDSGTDTVEGMNIKT